MFSPDQHQLLDFGQGRKLERFGGLILDRPCPAAEAFPRNRPALWRQADARYQRGRGNQGEWSPVLESPWTIQHGQAVLELKPTPFGHLGVFVEQAENWDWIAAQIVACPKPLKVLNLFAYTGGSTLAAAAAGAEVVHVDASRSATAWARGNASLSGLREAPIRWIVEDARKFVRRECKRGNRYDAVILDPPSYGHGPKGQVWKVENDLPDLLAGCAELTAGREAFLLLTCHSPEVSAKRAEAMLKAAFKPFRKTAGQHRAGELSLRDPQGRELPCGVAARWSAG